MTDSISMCCFRNEKPPAPQLLVLKTSNLEWMEARDSLVELTFGNFMIA